MSSTADDLSTLGHLTLGGGRPAVVDPTPNPPDHGSRTEASEPDGDPTTSASQELEAPREVVFVRPRSRPSRPSFRLLAKWECFVTEVSDASFFAELHDLIGESEPMSAEFDLEELPEADRELATEGATFYWNIGYNQSTSGQIERASYIYFRRLPARFRKTRQQVRQAADSMNKRLKWTGD
jgi:hypothetical protein